MDISKEWYRSEFINHEMLEGHRIIETEFAFYDAIANGNLEYVKKDCKRNTFTNPAGMGKLSEKPLQNLRYHFVVTAAMITRYCVHAGMEQEKAYNLSDFYIYKMDACKSIPEIARLHDIMCLDFCKQMYILRSSQVLSKPIVLCIDYIYSHIHYQLRLHILCGKYYNESPDIQLSMVYHKYSYQKVNQSFINPMLYTQNNGQINQRTG